MSYQEHRGYVGGFRAVKEDMQGIFLYMYVAQSCSLWKGICISKVNPFVTGYTLEFSSLCRI